LHDGSFMIRNLRRIILRWSNNRRSVQYAQNGCEMLNP
jgi:uncharacterized protein YjiS (DUF1127 family)